MEIKISVKSYSKNYFVYLNLEKNECLINGELRDIDVLNCCRKITKITANWPDKLMGNGLDGVSYNISLLDGNFSKNCEGDFLLPDNFYQLMDIVKEIEQNGNEQQKSSY